MIKEMKAEEEEELYVVKIVQPESIRIHTNAYIDELGAKEKQRDRQKVKEEEI